MQKGGTGVRTGAKIESGRAILSPGENPWRDSYVNLTS